MNRALKKTFKAIKTNIRISATTTSKIIIRRRLVSEPSDNNSLSTTISANRITHRKATNVRRKPRSIIEIIHDKKKHFTQHEPKRAALFRASISRPRYYRLRKHLLAALLTARRIYSNERTCGRRVSHRPTASKNSSTKRAGHNFSPFPLLLSSSFHCNQD